MISVERRERIRRAYYVEGKSMRRIANELRHSYWTVRDAVESAQVRRYTLQAPKPAPVLGPYQQRIDELLLASEQMPRKQRYTGRKVYELLKAEGYQGSASNLRRYIGERRRELKRPQVYLPLSFEPGVDAQVDWGEAIARLQGEVVKVELFVMRLCYSRKLFVMAFPTERQEAFFAGHVAAFHHFGGVPQRLSYDNLKIAVKRILEGRNRQEQESFVAFRSHYLFESRYCTPNQGHEKGGVEHGVGYARRNFLVPMPVAASFAELNAWLLAACQADDARRVDRQVATIAEMWKSEQPYMRTLPDDFVCCRSHEVTLNPYGQVVFETNRYSVPAELARKHLTLRAYPFHIEILDRTQVIARHQRCYGRQQDLLDPLHYLPLLAERPGAFEHATPLQSWRRHWSPVYEQLLAHLRQNTPGTSAEQVERQAIRTFIHILMLQRDYPAAQVEQAVTTALATGIAHLEGVRYCLHRLLDPTPQLLPLKLTHQPHLATIGTQPVTLADYNQLLGGGQ
jgi:transposase